MQKDNTSNPYRSQSIQSIKGLCDFLDYYQTAQEFKVMVIYNLFSLTFLLKFIKWF